MEDVLEKPVARYVGRLAPSPTGALHLGNVRTFMVAWLRARRAGGRLIMRMDDLDHPKDKPGAAAAALDDLRWLGFGWDEEAVQSERIDVYRQALTAIRDRIYPCVCSRRDVEAAQSAPHAGEQLYYPGTCRGRFPTWSAALAFKQSSLAGSSSSSLSPFYLRHQTFPCWRFRVPDRSVVAIDDVFAGRYEQDVSATLGDFPLARDEFGAGYTFASAVDDLLLGVTEVVRGDDLLPATPAQILLSRALLPHVSTVRTPRLPDYLHVPLVVGPDGKRLAKRHGDTRVSTFRAQGRRPEEIVGFLAASCGWAARGEPVALADLLPRFDLATLPHAPFVVPQLTADGGKW